MVRPTCRGDPRDLVVDIAAAARMFDLGEWNTFTHGTSLVVLAGGRLVHEWYADGLGRSEPQSVAAGGLLRSRRR